MNITVIQERGSRKIRSHETGGEYATNDVTIYVDKNLPHRTKQSLVIHSVIENYCLPWEHKKVEELADLIMEALDKLRGK